MWAQLQYNLLGSALYASLVASCTYLAFNGSMPLASLGFILVQGEQMASLGQQVGHIITAAHL